MSAAGKARRAAVVAMVQEAVASATRAQSEARLLAAESK